MTADSERGEIFPIKVVSDDVAYRSIISHVWEETVEKHPAYRSADQ